MKIHEYQAKELFQKYDVPIPRGRVAFSPEEALSRAQELGSFPAVIKAQIHAGGRGKGGGVKLVKSAAEAEQAADRILSRPLVTHQTGPEGVPVRQVGNSGRAARSRRWKRRKQLRWKSLRRGCGPSRSRRLSRQGSLSRSWERPGRVGNPRP